MGKKRCIIGIGPDLVTPYLRALFDPADAIFMPCFAILDGSLQGKIFTDRPDHPTWGAVLDCSTGQLYLGGEIHYHCLRRLVGRLRRTGKVELVLSHAIPADVSPALRHKVDILNR